jgi:hypothetical protein
VGANAVASANFRRDANKSKFTSALMYKLRRKKHRKSNTNNTRDTSTSFQLLIIWGPHEMSLGDLSICDFTARALLIKHSNTITWDEDKLKKLHSMHLPLLNKGLSNDMIDLFAVHPTIIKDAWLLDDATALMTTAKREEEDRTIEITISKISEETIEDDFMAPLGVPSNM